MKTVPVMTIKVSSELRDQLRSQAHAHGRTLGEHLQALADDEARSQRFRELREAMMQRPSDADYHADVTDWQGKGWV